MRPFLTGLLFSLMLLLTPARAGDLDSDRSPFNWGGALKQAGLFLGIQHSFRIATERGTREELAGRFWKDYAASVEGLHGWGDGDPFIVNDVAHPFEGAVAGFIEVQNDPGYRRAEFGRSEAYWRSRFRAMAFAAAFSTQFEIGPLSEASIGNVGKPHRPSSGSGACDLVVTPVAGFGVMLAEDALDRYVTKRVDTITENRVVRLLTRSVLNPNRSFANLMRGRWPWYRDDRNGVSVPYP